MPARWTVLAATNASTIPSFAGELSETAAGDRRRRKPARAVAALNEREHDVGDDQVEGQGAAGAGNEPRRRARREHPMAADLSEHERHAGVVQRR